MTIELFREYRSHPTKQLRDRIFAHNYKLACEIAHQFASRCNEPFEDLLQLSAMGMITAIERFDPYRGFPFSSFACPYMKGEIYHYLRDKSSPIKIPRSLQNLYQRGKNFKGTDRQIAESLGVTEWEWLEAKAACTGHQPLNLDSVETELMQPNGCDCEGIEPIALVGLEDRDRTLLEMLFLQGKPLKEVRRSAIASGIRAKDVKSTLKSAVLSLQDG